ncbi:Uncharacterized conserved protein, DUF1697 family [Catalinimonas alkaloidigena]|uniref:Uncharacterized conserved protein, DUF1697 family n=1 Tax=Catalinimonas alkaloidigena TaxID=1075417 RepID=A0A1G9H998_9BACT|nr:DUF1697 domain-containing protein [Catalinimonas alkaloidigena]SDL09447.1 Uncharacterized conserved protein, DUF1697 family [Catalinimonas alkaloidigena]
MNTYIAILRGINVSGSHKLKMADLQQALQEAGYRQVQTYIQSGNVVLSHDTAEPSALAQEIRALMARKFGYEVPVLVLSSADLQKVLSENPFLRERHEDPAPLHVTFLSEAPSAAALTRLEGVTSGPDEYRLHGNVIYLFCPNGYGRTKLTNNFFEQKLRVTATTRNWKTCLKLAEMATAP